jgi:hypothetical protein
MPSRIGFTGAARAGAGAAAACAVDAGALAGAGERVPQPAQSARMAAATVIADMDEVVEAFGVVKGARGRVVGVTVIPFELSSCAFCRCCRTPNEFLPSCPVHQTKDSRARTAHAFGIQKTHRAKRPAWMLRDVHQCSDGTVAAANTLPPPMTAGSERTESIDARLFVCSNPICIRIQRAGAVSTL